MKKLKNKLGGLVFCAAQIALGVVILIDAVRFTSMIITAIGAILALAGIFNIIKYFFSPAKEAAMEQLLSKGMIALGAGIFAILKGASLIKDAFKLIIIIFGVILLVAGINKVQFIADSIRRRERRWYFGIISAALSLGCGILVLINPFGTEEILLTFTGIALIADAAIDAFSILAVTDKAKKPKPEPKPETEIIEGEAEEVEE